MQEIIRYQTDRNLDKNKYDGLNEAANTIEEVLESLGYDIPKNNRLLLKNKIKLFIKNLTRTQVVTVVNLTVEDKVDAHADQIVFAIGALLKLGYDPIKVLRSTGLEINSRTGSMVDGKFEKDLSKSSDWIKADYTKCTRI